MTERLRLSACLLAVVVGSLLVASCGVDQPTEYSSDNKEAFLAACIDADTDGLYQQRLCLCAYEEAEASIPFERFREINEQLEDADSAVLPSDLLDVLATCIIEEGDL